MKFICSGIIAAAIVLASVGAEAGQMATLGSGKTIELLAGGPLIYGQGQKAVMMQYRTQIAMSDMAALTQEADEVFDRFAVDADHAGVTVAVISAQSEPQGTPIQSSQSYNFVFEKKNGAWHPLADDKLVKLDKDFVSGVVKNVDGYYSHNEMNSMLLFLADNWQGTSEDATGKHPPVTLDRIKFAQMTFATLSATKDYHHQRAIKSIDISRDGTSAIVKSTETEDGSVNGQAHEVVSDDTDTIELRGGHVLFAKSDSVVHVK